MEGKAIIALDGEEFAGFCYIETWGNKQFVANSGLIVVEKNTVVMVWQNALSIKHLNFPEADFLMQNYLVLLRERPS